MTKTHIKLDLQTIYWIKAVLHNDEVSTNEELIEYFTKNGLPRYQAKQWVLCRSKFMGRI